MTHGKQATAKRRNMAERARHQMEIHFPDTPPVFMWHRKTNDGYTTLPRTLPIAMQAIDSQSKGQPAGHTLLCLWARSPDHVFVTIENPITFASEAGFLGERKVDTWRKRMKTLQKFGFIFTKPGASGQFHYVLLINPNVALEQMRSKGLVQDELYSRFIDRTADIGAYSEIEAIREHMKTQAAPPPEPPATTKNPILKRRRK